MILTDTHAHLADSSLYHQLPVVLRQANDEGISRFIAPSASDKDWPILIELQSSAVYCAFGFHPWFVDGADADGLVTLETLLDQNPRALVGEIGLDYYGKKGDSAVIDQQKRLFTRQLDLAQAFRRPVILHNVRAGNDLIHIIKCSRFSCGGFAHAFSGSLEEAYELIKLGFKIGIGSLMLNPAAKKARRAAMELPLDAIVLETDSPFMLHNQINTPANTRRIAEEVAALRGISLGVLSAQTEKNVDEILAF
ncbi:MAG: TatD family hydrolase [Neisseria sp.]|uniref:TatD family hydrolase n=1 Tax=Neisseria sp. TaxID=192066 RepID=UPI0026DB92AF|nr:TatD family hydrolase [Neisseria sp.]MDO4640980.1 TatD family hydrolase [Neisseria sp.]